MALNPYTLYSLYEKGILEYTPLDLMVGTPMGAMMPMSNPYLDMAKQGGLYNNYGAHNDTFSSSNMGNSSLGFVGNNSYALNQQNNGNYTAETNGLGADLGIIKTFNGANGGIYNQSGIANTFGFDGNLGSKSKSSIMGTFGFEDTTNGIYNGVNSTMSVIERTPKVILGLLAATIGYIGIAAAFRRGKKPTTVTNKGSNFLSKINPKNWFKNVSWQNLKFWKKK